MVFAVGAQHAVPLRIMCEHKGRPYGEKCRLNRGNDQFLIHVLAEQALDSHFQCHLRARAAVAGPLKPQFYKFILYAD